MLRGLFGGFDVSSALFRYAKSGTSLLALLAITSFSGTSAQAQIKRPNQSSAVSILRDVTPASLNSPLIAVVSLNTQRINIFDHRGIVASAPISSGQRGHETPEGVFTILQKEEEHTSNVYDDASMPFMQRLTWSGVALHAGALPGYPASHGCIRLPYDFAQRLFSMTRLHTRVVVAPFEAEPAPISHPVLFQPNQTVILSASLKSDGDHKTPPALRGPDGSLEGPMMLGARLPKPDAAPSSDTSQLPQKSVLRLREDAFRSKLSTADVLAKATKAAEAAKASIRGKQIDAAKAERIATALEANARRFVGRVSVAERQVEKARNADGAERAKIQLARLVDERMKLEKAATEARDAAKTKLASAKSALEVAKSAEEARVAAAIAAKVAARTTEPISVYISRTTGKLYMRQATQPVTEMPITIRDANKPIGTHIFTVTDTEEGGSSVKWSVVSLQPSPAMITTEVTDRRGRRQVLQKPDKAITRDQQVAAASQALDRIDIPEAALAKIRPYLYPGASFLVSDLGPSIETGPGTDFVVQTKGEEAAAAFIAKFVAQKKAEAAEERRGRRRFRDDGRFRDDD